MQLEAFVPMPCPGLIPFLHYGVVEGRLVKDPVSMPCLGLIPFLRIRMCSMRVENLVCQCPVSGLSHFYKPKNLRQLQNLRCVNALSRAYPISTEYNYQRSGKCVVVSMPCLGLIPFLRYLLKNLVKSMISGPVFRG